MTESRLSRIAIVTPYPWNVPHPVNDHVAEVADGFSELRRRDAAAPEVLVVAPSADTASRRRARRALRDLARGSSPDQVLAAPELDAPAPGARRGEPEHDWPLLALAPAIGPASVAVRSSLSIVLERAAVDVLVVHDPLEGDLTRLAVRRWSGLTIGVFHDAPSVGVLALLAGAHRERILEALDSWLVPSEDPGVPLRLRAALEELVPDSVEALPTVAAAAASESPAAADGPDAQPAGRIVLARGADDDAAVRALLRALAAVDELVPQLEVLVLSRWGKHHRPPAPRWLRGRMRAVTARMRSEADAALAGAAAMVALPNTPARAAAEAAAQGVPVVHVAVGAVEETVPAAVTQLQRALHEPAATAAEFPPRWALAQSLAQAAGSLHAKRKPQVHLPAPRAAARTCVIDLHMHTNHSWDCATEPEALLFAAREMGLTAVAVTDHNEVSGALACAELAEEYGVQVIVGEEVKTESQGEVIGLFLRERIEPGLSWEETIARIREQDGLVYVPHPFDRLHTIPDVRTLRDSLDEIDAFEVYNSRLTFERFNRDAERFARKYNLIEGAGSDAHVPQGLGTAAVQMPEWDDPESFLTALRQGEILRRPKSLVYLQGLKRMHQVAGRAGTGKQRD